jgi:Glycosyl transferases group 1
MKICLFDWNAGGHHDFYAHAFAEALAPRAEVIVAASDPLLAGLDLPAVETHSLGSPRPRAQAGAGPDKAALAKREIELLNGAIAATGPDQAVILFADPILRWLAGAPKFDCRLSVFVMFANAHFPRAYDLPLTRRERLSAGFKGWNIGRWRRRADSGVVFGLDQAAVAGWNRKRGAAAVWLPEPTLEFEPEPVPATERSGCFLFGYFDERKGTDRLAAALGSGSEGLELALYGDVAPEYRERLDREVRDLERGGVKLETDFRRVPYASAMKRMAHSRCALLSFGWKPSGSRVLLEAAAARTPVVVGNDSAVGRLVERHGLGTTADPSDPHALREAILALALDPNAPARYEEGLRRYAEELHGDRFAGEVREALGLPR